MPWYKKTWGKVVIVLGFCILIYVFLLGILSLRYFKDIKDGVRVYEAAIQERKYDFSEKNNEIALLVETPDDPSHGPAEAALTIVEFYDYNCPHCRAFFSTIRRLTAEYPEVRFILKDMPITSDDSVDLAEASECAQDQGRFWEFHDRAFLSTEYLTQNNIPAIIQGIAIDEEKFYNCLQTRRYEKEVAADLDAGLEAGVTGTPTVFINGHRVPGEIPYDTFKTIIDTTLQSLTKTK